MISRQAPSFDIAITFSYGVLFVRTASDTACKVRCKMKSLDFLMLLHGQIDTESSQDHILRSIARRGRPSHVLALETSTRDSTPLIAALSVAVLNFPPTDHSQACRNQGTAHHCRQSEAMSSTPEKVGGDSHRGLVRCPTTVNGSTGTTGSFIELHISDSCSEA